MVIPVNVSLCSRALGSCVASSFLLLEASECAWRLEPSYKILLLCWEYLHAPCSLLLTPKEFLTRPVLGIVLPCRIPMLGYLKCFPAAPPRVLEFIDIGGDFSLKNWSVTRPGTKQEVTSSLGSYYIKCVGLLVGKVAFYGKSNFPASMQATIFKQSTELQSLLHSCSLLSLLLCLRTPYFRAVQCSGTKNKWIQWELTGKEHQPGPTILEGNTNEMDCTDK